jgi:hypothetical protein
MHARTRARTLWCGATAMNSGGTMDTASWRVMLPASLAAFINSWMSASHCVERGGQRVVRTEGKDGAGVVCPRMLITAMFMRPGAVTRTHTRHQQHGRACAQHNTPQPTQQRTHTLSLRSWLRENAMLHASLLGYQGSGAGGTTTSPSSCGRQQACGGAQCVGAGTCQGWRRASRAASCKHASSCDAQHAPAVLPSQPQRARSHIHARAR